MSRLSPTLADPVERVRTLVPEGWILDYFAQARTSPLKAKPWPATLRALAEAQRLVREGRALRAELVRVLKPPKDTVYRHWRNWTPCQGVELIGVDGRYVLLKVVQCDT